MKMNSKVYFLSKNWNLVINMMIGIQQSLNSMMNYEREITDYDFIFKNKLDLTLTKHIYWQ